MALNLSSHPSIATGLFVKIILESETWLFSDFNQTIQIGDDVYQGLGKLVGITSTTSELKLSQGELTVTITGIPNSSLTNILTSKIKGADIIIRRGFFDPVTLQPIVATPVGRFYGIVNNYSVDEEYDVDSRQSINTIGLICASTFQTLQKKLAGRKTNPSSNRSFYPSDAGMDRVPKIVKANYDFGMAKK